MLTLPRNALNDDFFPKEPSPPVEWRISEGLVPYEAALAAMEAHVAAMAQGDAGERVWLLEHPALYTAGTSAKPKDLKEARFPVFSAGRGGQYTYHGPGQRVAYVMLDLRRRQQDVRAYVSALENWLIYALNSFNIKGERREDRVGVWVRRPEKPSGPNSEPAEDKIAAIGLRLRRWISFHGIALNVEPDLSHYSGISPCGAAEPHYGVTSLVDLGLPVTMTDADLALRGSFETLFGPTILHKT